MKKIFYALSSNIYSGAENVVCTIINNLNTEYDCAYCSPYGPIEQVIKNKKIKFFGLNKMNKSNLKKIIEEYKPDIIHANDYKASVITALTGFNGKIISHLHNNCPFAKTWNLKTILYYYTLKKYSKIIGVSDKVFEEAIFKNKIKNKYITIYNYVDKENIFSKSTTSSNNSDKYDLFFLGRLTEQKNPRAFIEIIKKLKKEKLDISSVMIGDGEIRSECEKLIEKYKLQENIKLLGFCENPFSIIKKAKIGIMPSKWEGFGLAVIEAMILKKPVLNSGIGGLAEIFKNNNEFICNNEEEYFLKMFTAP